MINYYTYKASRKLINDQTLRVEWDSAELPATFFDPSESEEGELRYYLDDIEVYRDELPDFVTDALLDDIASDADQFVKENGPDDFDPNDLL